MTSVVSTKYYVLDDSSKDLLLSMSVGKGQISSSTIRLNTATIETGIRNGFKGRLIGNPSTLHNTILVLDVTVDDINPHTNDTMIDVKLSNGAIEQHQRFSGTADKDGGVVHYHLTYFLKVRQ